MKNVALIAALLLPLSLRAEDVPQFRGANGTGVSAETGLPLTWGEKENVRWKVELPGRGLSQPVIAGGRVFVTACSGYKQRREHVLCFDAKDGKQLWERQVWATGTTQCHPKTNMAAPTPATDGKHVYALFATGDLVCYDKDGNLAWYRSLVGDYPTVGNNVGMAASPILWNDLLIVCLENVGESFCAGVDAKTGQNRWRIERPRGINWVTPIVVRNDGRDDLIVIQPGHLTAYDPSTGTKRWALKESFDSIPSPVFGANTLVAVGPKTLGIRPPSGSGEAKVLWQAPKLRTGYASPLVYRGRVYSLATAGIVHCADAANGKILWSHRLGERDDEQYSASPLAAEGRIYVVGEKGTTTVLKAGDEAEVLATNRLPDAFLASPVASGGAIFLRSDRHLYCLAGVK